jgi:aspartate racemase
MNVVDRPRDVWGLLGGMGPLASAEFLATIYEQCVPETEQKLPTVLLLSDPAVPDRTEALLQGRELELAEEAAKRARVLLDGGATQLAFCCVTLHRIVPLLPPAILDRLVSLVDLVFDAVEDRAGSHLMLCSEGTRRAGVFQAHERWRTVSSNIRFLTDHDQAMLHSWIYQIKKNDRVDEHSAFITRLAKSYDASSCIAGCTELHMVAKRSSLDGIGDIVDWIDPLAILAARIAGRELIPPPIARVQADRQLPSGKGIP